MLAQPQAEQVVAAPTGSLADSLAQTLDQSLAQLAQEYGEESRSEARTGLHNDGYTGPVGPAGPTGSEPMTEELDEYQDQTLKQYLAAYLKTPHASAPEGDAATRARVAEQVRQRFAGLRNLCQDLRAVIVLETLPWSLAGEIEIDGSRSQAEIYANLYFECGKLVSSSARISRYEDALAEGQSWEQLLNGPLTRHGYVSQAQLARTVARSMWPGSSPWCVPSPVCGKSIAWPFATLTAGKQPALTALRKTIACRCCDCRAPPTASVSCSWCMAATPRWKPMAAAMPRGQQPEPGQPDVTGVAAAGEAGV